MVPLIDDDPDHSRELLILVLPLRMAMRPVVTFGFGTVVVGAVVVVVGVTDVFSVVAAAAVVEVVVVGVVDVVVVDDVESFDGVVLLGGVASFDGGVWFDGGVSFDGVTQGVVACCQRKNGRVWVSQIPQVFGLDAGFTQPDSMDHPAVSKNE